MSGVRLLFSFASTAAHVRPLAEDSIGTYVQYDTAYVHSTQF